MALFLNLTISISIILIGIKLIRTSDIYEKIISFYFIFTNAIILLIINSISKFENVIDLALLLFLAELIGVLFLLLNRKKF
jgi:hypothetical protein